MVTHGNQILLIPFERASTQGRKKGEISDIRPLENLERENEERGDSKNKRPVKAEKTSCRGRGGKHLAKEKPAGPTKQATSVRRRESPSPLTYMIWRIYIHKGRSILRSYLTSRIHFRESSLATFL